MGNTMSGLMQRQCFLTAIFSVEANLAGITAQKAAKSATAGAGVVVGA